MLWIAEADAVLVCAGAGLSATPGEGVCVDRLFVLFCVSAARYISPAGIELCVNMRRRASDGGKEKSGSPWRLSRAAGRRYVSEADFARHYPWMARWGYSTAYECMGLLHDPRVPPTVKCGRRRRRARRRRRRARRSSSAPSLPSPPGGRGGADGSLQSVTMSPTTHLLRHRAACAARARSASSRPDYSSPLLSTHHDTASARGFAQVGILGDALQQPAPRLRAERRVRGRARSLPMIYILRWLAVEKACHPDAAARSVAPDDI